MHKRSTGFTLIELMIVVAVVAILAAVAFPSYTAYVKRSIRAEAQAYMESVAGRQQQYLVDTRAYATLTQMNALIAAPTRVSAAYTIAMPDPTSSPMAFTMTLTPGTNQASDTCGTLSINQSGTKTATKNGSAVSGCW